MNSVVAALDQVVSTYMGRSLDCDLGLQGPQKNEDISQQDTQHPSGSTLALENMNVALSLPSLNTTQLEFTRALNAVSPLPNETCIPCHLIKATILIPTHP
jgi:hypothetical protein